MAIHRPDDLNRAVCEALGLDPSKVHAVTIKLHANRVTIVEVEQFVAVEDGNKLVPTLARYTLEPR